MSVYLFSNKMILRVSSAKIHIFPVWRLHAIFGKLFFFRMLATRDSGFTGKVRYYQSSTLERIQSVSLPKEVSSDWTRCQEYIRDVVPVNWSARDASVGSKESIYGGAYGTQASDRVVCRRGFLDSLAIFPAAGNVRRIWLGNAKGLVRLLVFSRPSLFLSSRRRDGAYT